VAAWSKVWVSGYSLAGIVGSNPAGGHWNLSLVCVVCCQIEYLLRADQSSRGVLPSVVWPVSVIKKPHKGRPWPGNDSKRTGGGGGGDSFNWRKCCKSPYYHQRKKLIYYQTYFSYSKSINYSSTSYRNKRLFENNLKYPYFHFWPPNVSYRLN